MTEQQLMEFARHYGIVAASRFLLATVALQHDPAPAAPTVTARQGNQPINPQAIAAEPEPTFHFWRNVVIGLAFMGAATAGMGYSMLAVHALASEPMMLLSGASAVGTYTSFGNARDARREREALKPPSNGRQLIRPLPTIDHEQVVALPIERQRAVLARFVNTAALTDPAAQHAIITLMEDPGAEPGSEDYAVAVATVVVQQHEMAMATQRVSTSLSNSIN